MRNGSPTRGQSQSNVDCIGLVAQFLECRVVHCSGCKKKLMHSFQVGMLGIQKKDGLEDVYFMLCPSCVHKHPKIKNRIEKRLIKEPLKYVASTLSDWVLVDKTFFVANPDRTTYLRSHYPGESTIPCGAVLVRKLNDGQHLRVYIPSVFADKNTRDCGEEESCKMWQLAMDEISKGETA